jgi:ubiquitin carboxyl-terminal hydrolase 7
MKNLHDSFRNYVSVSTLDGNNKHPAGRYGPQDAVLGISLLLLPPVLHMQLRNFKYDPVQDCMVKVWF